MKTGYAYLDQYGNLHIVESDKTAREYSGNRKVEVVTNIDFDNGYPQITEDGKRLPIVVKTNNGISEKEGRPIPQHIKDLVERLK